MNAKLKYKDITLLTRRILIAEGILFLLGMFFLGENEFVWYYYAGWFLLSAAVNLVLIVLLFVKRPTGYPGFVLSLFIVPPLLGFIAFFMIITAMGGIC
jgi:hypothetical protein